LDTGPRVERVEEAEAEEEEEEEEDVYGYTMTILT
jgi:hypothetical protein